LKATEAAYLAGIIDGEGTITLTKLHSNENRRPIISIASTDIELLEYIKSITSGSINKKRNYSPSKHKNSYTFIIKRKGVVLSTLMEIIPYLRVPSKIKRAKFIIENYEKVTIRNGRYNESTLVLKQDFENDFFAL